MDTKDIIREVRAEVRSLEKELRRLKERRTEMEKQERSDDPFPGYGTNLNLLWASVGRKMVMKETSRSKSARDKAETDVYNAAPRASAHVLRDQYHQSQWRGMSDLVLVPSLPGREEDCRRSNKRTPLHLSEEQREYQEAQSLEEAFFSCCFLCLSPDHGTRDCPTLAGDPCRMCGREGHLAYMCLDKKRPRRDE